MANFIRQVKEGFLHCIFYCSIRKLVYVCRTLE